MSACPYPAYAPAVSPGSKGSQGRAKGWSVSKGFFGILNYPKKRTIKFDFTTMVPQVELFSFVFWEN